MRHTLIIALGLTLAACSDKDDEDDGSGVVDEDGGATDGGSADGGTTDGGTTDGGSGDGGSSGSDIADLLVNSGGCSDAFIWATNTEQTWAMTYRDDSGIAERAHARGETVTDSYDMAMDHGLAPSVSVLQGSDLRSDFCNDVVKDFTVDQEWSMTAGIVTIEVTPTGEPKDWGAFPASATLTLDGAVFTTMDADPVEIGSWTTTVEIGWLPG